MNWTMKLTKAPDWAIESYLYKPNSTIWYDNEYYQIVAYSYERYEDSTLAIHGVCKHGVRCIVFDTYFALIDKEAKAVVMKTKDQITCEKACDRRTEEKLNRIDKILLEE